jgi:hypothetical protein
MVIAAIPADSDQAMSRRRQAIETRICHHKSALYRATDQSTRDALFEMIRLLHRDLVEIEVRPV